MSSSRRSISHGTFGSLRANCLCNGPPANPGVRRAMLAVVDQVDVMTAVMGGDPSLFRAPAGFCIPGAPSETDTGMDRSRRPGKDEIKAMLKQAGYAGERIVFMHPTDPDLLRRHVCSVAVAAFREIGLNIDEQATDWGTVVERRSNREALDKGGWSMFPYGAPAADYRDPIFATNLRGNGKGAWFGWPDDPKAEELRNRWMDSNDATERHRLDAEIQANAFETVLYIPLGQYLLTAAYTARS